MSPARLPFTTGCGGLGRPSNIFSELVSGASSAVALSMWLGSDILAMVRHALAYCTGSEPATYGRSYLSHTVRTRTAASARRLDGMSG